jgi:hypothetical protein
MSDKATIDAFMHTSKLIFMDPLVVVGEGCKSSNVIFGDYPFRAIPTPLLRYE